MYYLQNYLFLGFIYIIFSFSSFYSQSKKNVLVSENSTFFDKALIIYQKCVRIDEERM